ncbi:translation initiation factor IF-2-like [Lagopus leucura]|uniref:translation initiation factor IF-2-like n=1 Tax=Lagopus leucura TaxID=30410 RepID=UPI001C67EA70|nr:translation initiation factor IF-2-like [Lagopus leucura]
MPRFFSVQLWTELSDRARVTGRTQGAPDPGYLFHAAQSDFTRDKAGSCQGLNVPKARLSRRLRAAPPRPGSPPGSPRSPGRAVPCRVPQAAVSPPPSIGIATPSRSNAARPPEERSVRCRSATRKQSGRRSAPGSAVPCRAPAPSPGPPPSYPSVPVPVPVPLPAPPPSPGPSRPRRARAGGGGRRRGLLSGGRRSQRAAGRGAGAAGVSG